MGLKLWAAKMENEDQRIKMLISRCGVVRYYQYTTPKTQQTEGIHIFSSSPSNLDDLSEVLEREYNTQLQRITALYNSEGKEEREIGLIFPGETGEQFWLSFGKSAAISKNITLVGNAMIWQNSVSKIESEREVREEIFGIDGPTKSLRRKAYGR